MMAGSSDAARRLARHRIENSKIIELAPELADRFAQIISARYRRARRLTQAQPRRAAPGFSRLARNGNARDIAPTNPGAFKAIANRVARNPRRLARSRHLAFFNRDDFAARIEQRR